QARGRAAQRGRSGRAGRRAMSGAPVSERVLQIGAGATAHLERLIEKSYDDYLDVNRSLDWQWGVDRARAPKRPECCWLYHTPEWHALSEAQRLDLLWKENARDVGTFIWLEQTLPPVYVGYVNTHGDRMPPAVREYMMIFAKEEIVHTLMFRRYVELAGLTLF